MKSRMLVRDLIAEAVAGMVERPGRSLLTALGTVIGVGAFVAVLGLTTTAAGQISSRFTALRAVEVLAEDVGLATPGIIGPSFTPDADARVQQIAGVVHAGVYWTVPPSKVGYVAGSPGAEAEREAQPVLAATAGFVDVIRPRMQSGRTFDVLHDRRADRVAILGAGVAARLGIQNVTYQPAVFINGLAFTVLGVIDQVDRQPEVLLSIVVPRRTAEQIWGIPDDANSPPRMLIETRLGAAQIVGGQVALALRPDAPERFKVNVPPDPRSLHDAVDTDLSKLFLLLAGLCLLIGAVGIANTSLVAVLERTNEIGLRRALGARTSHIAVQVLAETASLGLFGGLFGAALGVTTTVLVAFIQRWTPAMAPWTVLAAPLVGALVGIAAGIHPAVSAARIQPADALRR